MPKNIDNPDRSCFNLVPPNINSPDLKFDLCPPRCYELLVEYCKLATLPTLSEANADRMAEILELAESDSELNFWIEEADHFLDHWLHPSGKDDQGNDIIESDLNQLAMLREYHGCDEFWKSRKPNPRKDREIDNEIQEEIIGQVCEAFNQLLPEEQELLCLQKDNPDLANYWEQKKQKFDKLLLTRGFKWRDIACHQQWKCAHCSEYLFNREEIELHGIRAIKDSGNDSEDKLQLVHKRCHSNLWTTSLSRMMD